MRVQNFICKFIVVGATQLCYLPISFAAPSLSDASVQQTSFFNGVRVIDVTEQENRAELSSKQTDVTSVINGNYRASETDNPDDDSLNNQKIVPLNNISPKTLQNFVELIDVIRTQYINETNDEDLFVNAMQGMLKNLDPHSEFLDENSLSNLKALTAGQLAQIGISAQYSPDEHAWIITNVQADSPAATADIKVGYYLHQIDHMLLRERTRQHDVNQMLMGLAGSQVQLTVSDAGRRKHSVTLQRVLTSDAKVTVSLNDNVAVVKIPVFQQVTKQQIIDGLVALKAPFVGIVIDVRNNPGGLLQSAVDIASLFLPSDSTVVKIEKRQEMPQVLTTYGANYLQHIPIVVLQNRYSASASEVLASSLQQRDNLTVMGELSYGKGTVQSVIPIGEYAVKLTVANYIAADGRVINGIGVVPNNTISGLSKDQWQNEAVAWIKQQAIKYNTTMQPIQLIKN